MTLGFQWSLNNSILFFVSCTVAVVDIDRLDRSERHGMVEEDNIQLCSGREAQCPVLGSMFSEINSTLRNSTAVCFALQSMPRDCLRHIIYIINNQKLYIDAQHQQWFDSVSLITACVAHRLHAIARLHRLVHIATLHHCKLFISLSSHLSTESQQF